MIRISLGLLAILAGLQESPLSIETLIARMNSEDLKERDQAQSAIHQRWQTWTDAELSKLRRVLDSDSAELATRAKAALSHIADRRRYLEIPTEVWRAFPDLGTLLLGGSPDKVGRLLLAMEDLSDHGGITARALAPAAIEFIEDARDTGIGSGFGDMGREHTYSVNGLASGLLHRAAPALGAIDRKSDALAWWKKNSGKTDRQWNLEGLGHEDGGVRTQSIIRLAALKDESLDVALFDALATITGEYEYARAMKSLLWLPSATVLPQLRKHLKGSAIKIRLKALEILAEVEDPAVEAILVDAVEDPAQRTGEYYGVISNPRVCDKAGQFLASRMNLEIERDDWLESIRARDSLLERIRNGWRTTQGMPATRLSALMAEAPRTRVDELIPRLVHKSVLKRAEAQRELCSLPPPAWSALESRISGSDGRVRERLTEASRAFLHAVRSITPENADAVPFCKAASCLMSLPFDFDTMHRKVLEPWFEDRQWAELTLLVIREQDGRGVSITIEVHRNKSPEVRPRGFWVWNFGSGALWRWNKENFDDEMRRQFSALKDAQEEGPDGQAGLSLRLAKAGPEEESLSGD